MHGQYVGSFLQYLPCPIKSARVQYNLLTIELPNSGVNTSPPVSEYEGIMLRNYVNPMSQFAQSLHGLETSASLTLLFHSRCLPSSSLPEFSFFIADDPLHDVHHNFKANLRDQVNSTPSAK